MTRPFSLYDTRHYTTVDVVVGFGEWATTYDQTVHRQLDLDLLAQLQTVPWPQMRCAVDLGCGTGRIGQWLRQQGVSHVHGVDRTFPMACRAMTKQAYATVCLADLTHCPFPSHTYDLAITVLTASHVPDLQALYTEGARLLRPGGVFVVLDYHPFFLLRGIPTHFDRAPGESIAIANVVHFFSDHVTSGRAVNWTLVEMQERLVDQVWVAQQPRMARYLHQPVSFALVWRANVVPGATAAGHGSEGNHDRGYSSRDTRCQRRRSMPPSGR
jgi:SAM-dependent methyltransferase